MLEIYLEGVLTDTLQAIEQIPDKIAERLGEEKAKKPKRKKSAYNEFIASCMKGGGTTMKECALGWKKQKPKKAQE